jgi:hypothetical protein
MSNLACAYAATAIGVLFDIRDEVSGQKRGWLSVAWYGLGTVSFILAAIERLAEAGT